MENESNLTILKGEALEAQTKAEVDISISTAKKYPRDIRKAIGDIEAIATQDKETAEACFFSLPRAGKVITGESVRLAEIVVNCWGNINAGYRIIGNDGKTITAQAIVHDLEKNVRISSEVIRRITGRDGKTFNDDMQIVTGNAAGSIAFRNAVFKTIPKALISGLLDKIKDVAIGKSIDIETRRGKAVDYFKKLGVTEKEILSTLNVNSIEEIGRDELLVLIGLTTALKDGETTVNDTFRKTKPVNVSITEEAQAAVFGEKKELKPNSDFLSPTESIEADAAAQKKSYTYNAKKTAPEVKKQEGKLDL